MIKLSIQGSWKHTLSWNQTPCCVHSTVMFHFVLVCHIESIKTYYSLWFSGYGGELWSFSLCFSCVSASITPMSVIISPVCFEVLQESALWASHLNQVSQSSETLNANSNLSLGVWNGSSKGQNLSQLPHGELQTITGKHWDRHADIDFYL